MEYYSCLGPLVLFQNSSHRREWNKRSDNKEETQVRRGGGGGGFATLWLEMFPPIPLLFSGRPEEGRISCHKSCSNLGKVEPHLLLLLHLLFFYIYFSPPPTSPPPFLYPSELKKGAPPPRPLGSGGFFFDFFVLCIDLCFDPIQHWSAVD